MDLLGFPIAPAEIWQYIASGALALAGALGFWLNYRTLRKVKLEQKKLTLEIRRLEEDLAEAGNTDLVKVASIEDADKVIEASKRIGLIRYLREPRSLTGAELKVRALAETLFLARKSTAAIQITAPSPNSSIEGRLNAKGTVSQADTYRHLYFGVFDPLTKRIGVDIVHDVKNGQWCFERVLEDRTATGDELTLFVLLSDREIPVFPKADLASILDGPNAQVKVARRGAT